MTKLSIGRLHNDGYCQHNHMNPSVTLGASLLAIFVCRSSGLRDEKRQYRSQGGACTRVTRIGCRAYNIPLYSIRYAHSHLNKPSTTTNTSLLDLVSQLTRTRTALVDPRRHATCKNELCCEDCFR